MYHTCPSPLSYEVAIIGRSNAGKSSLLNRLAGATNLARVSSTPGRTQSLVFFGWADRAQTLVDLPGYGYAKTSRAIQKGWKRLIESYLLKRPNLSALVLVMDCRRELAADEFLLLDLARSRGLAVCIAMNKSDKLGNSKLAIQKRKLLHALQDRAENPSKPDVICCSASKNNGCNEQNSLGAWVLTQLGMDGS